MRIRPSDAPQQASRPSQNEPLAVEPVEDFGTRIERWTRHTIDLHGSGRFVVQLTAVVALASTMLTVAAMGIAFGPTNEILTQALILGLLGPTLVVPPLAHASVRLATRLEATERDLRLATSLDPVSGALNRGGFFHLVNEFIQSGSNGLLGVVDIDQLDVVNQQHGRARGDQALHRTADWLSTLAGEDGFVGRMDADAFAFVIPSSEAPKLPIGHTLLVDDSSFSITIGTATFTGGNDFEAALLKADDALYRLKGMALEAAGRGTPQLHIRHRHSSRRTSQQIAREPKQFQVT